MTRTDINPDDRQTFKSAEKIMQPCVLAALEKHVIDSEATVQYISLIRDFLQPFTDPTMDNSQRIYVYWRALFFLRIWRAWILKNHDINENFLTNETYACLEINGHSLVNLVINLHKENRPDHFLPILFNSQCCEKTFRTIRSMTTMCWTRINASMAEMLHLFKRLEVLNDMIYTKLPEKGLSITRINKISKMAQSTLPNSEQIKALLQNARNDADKMADKFCIKSSNRNSYICSLKVINTLKEGDKNRYLINENSSDVLNNHQNTNIIDESSPFVRITNECGETELVRKTTLIWFLSEGKYMLSNDRIRRVQGPCLQRINDKNKENHEPMKGQDSRPLTRFQVQQKKYCFYKANVINIGDWCFFKMNNSSENRKKNCRNSKKKNSIW